MEKLRLGQITNVVGLNGEIKVYPYTDYKEKFEEIEYVLIKDKKYFIEHVRYNKNMVILKLDGIDNRNTAENYKESELFIDQKDVPTLP
jgi:16S rRNA processing protein RimM